MNKNRTLVRLPNTSIKSGKWYTANRDLYCICYGLCFKEKQSYYCEVDGLLRNESNVIMEIDNWTTSFHESTNEEIRPGYKKICKNCKLKNCWSSCELGYCYRYLYKTKKTWKDWQKENLQEISGLQKHKEKK